MKLTLLSQQNLSVAILPEKCAGRFWVRSKNRAGKFLDIVAVEAQRNAETNGAPQWVLRSNRKFKVLDGDGRAAASIPLSPLALYRIESTDLSMNCVLYTEPLSEDRKQYKVYELTGQNARLTIGREADNDIVYFNDFVSRHHAEIAITSGGMIVRDLMSMNHTYLNGNVVQQEKLKNGDAIYVMGMQIVVAGRFVYLNNPDGMVSVRYPALREYHAAQLPPTGHTFPEEDDVSLLETEYYYRAPRFRQDTGTFELKLDAPPADQDKDNMPMAMVIGPSMTMGLASAATGVYTVTNAIARNDFSSAIPSLVMSLSMLLGTLVWPLITRIYQSRRRKRREAARQTSYTSYLAGMEQLIAQETARQENILRESNAASEAYVARILSPVPQIWERTRKHTDFLTVRLGHGNLPLRANIQCPERRFSLEEDNLTEVAYRFGEQSRWLTDVPVCLPLTERYVSGIYVDRQHLTAYANHLLLQLTALHGYDEVKIALICGENDAETFSFMRWIPHTMDHGRTVRYIATNSAEAKALSAALDPVIEYRKNLTEDKRKEESPYFVIVCLDKELADKTECIRRIQEYKSNLSFSVLHLYERFQDLPKECSAVAGLQGSKGSLTLIDDSVSRPLEFQADALELADMHRAMRVLANTEINIGDAGYTLPTQYTFFEMLDVGMIEHLNIIDRWRSNDPTRSLAAAIGIDKYGEPFKLDLHERAHGPHGLIAGMTGSGKSEFVISYILSMATNFHPDEVAFILIDYKGGGMAKSFEHIPHTAGVITNLDGNGITRSLASMRSELHRRERIFRDVSQQHNVSNIDIYKYQKLYRKGRVKEPLPHLFIISDEFAELKKEQPDFMTELTSTARVGRSLGVHLILATQKPGGVVDDQIRSNSRFRVCLKVQDNGDSMEMLGRPEAAALVNTGRFYLLVGNDELFELGQSAWAGAPYYPAPRTIRNHDDAVTVINTNGQVIAEANIDRFASVKDPPKQIDVVTSYIQRVCEEEGIKHWKMWLDPIPARIYVNDLAERYQETGQEDHAFTLAPIVGEIDNPAHQSQDLLRVPLTRDGNAAVYGSTGSGKAMFLEAMCYSLIREHTPQEVNLYILDFGAEMLTAFAGAPHVGDVILSYETEKVQNLFKLLLGKLSTRKKLFSRFGGSFIQYNEHTVKPEPNLVVIINNYAAFTELFEDRAGDINYLTREGVRYGIYFVLACTGVNNIKFSLRQNFSSLYCLQLNNTDDYSTIVGRTGNMLPEKYKGRGLVRLDKDSLLEFQTAHITGEDPPYQFIRTFAREESAKYNGARAAGVPVLPEQVTEQFLIPGIRPGDLSRLPVGVAKETLEIASFDFTASPVNLILSLTQEWQAFADALSLLAANRCGVDTMVLAPSGKSRLRTDGGSLRVYTDLNRCVEAAREIFSAVLTRNNTYKDALSAGTAPPEFEPLLVVIQSMSQLKTVLSRYKPLSDAEKMASDDTPLNRLQLAMEKDECIYRVYFIVAEGINALTPFTAENWYKTHVGGGSGIWIGNGIQTQYRLNANRKPQEASGELGSGFGFTVENGAATLVKFLQ